MTQTYSELYQMKMEPFVKTVNALKLLTVFTKAPSYMFDRVLNTHDVRQKNVLEFI